MSWPARNDKPNWRVVGCDRRVARCAWLWLTLAAVGCAGSRVPSNLRFYNHDPVWRVQDRTPIPKPKKRSTGDGADNLDGNLRAPVLYALAVPGQQLAQNVNALGEVPSSAWFENRIGVRELAPEELADDPATPAPGQLRVLSAKNYGALSGFMAEDGSGTRHLIKFDPENAPEAETGAEVVVQRLLWAAGYHVPHNRIVCLQPDELSVDPEATRTLPTGQEVRFTRAALFAMLQDAPHEPSGCVRAVASQYLPGEPVGGFAMSGVRRDDPNDRVPHEHLRELRGLRVFYGWVGQTDAKESNTLDMWLPTTADGTRGHVVHYVLDFGKALGTTAIFGLHEHDGFAPHFDYDSAVHSLFALGAWTRPWEGITAPALRGVGRYEAVRFDPARTAPARWSAPFLYADRFDNFWAAKIIARFTHAHIATAVVQGRYTDPRARAYLTRTIYARARSLARHHFAQVNPLDQWRVSRTARGTRICATDLLIAHGLSAASGSRYTVRAYDWHGHELPWSRTASARADGALCVDAVPEGGSHAGYTLLVARTFRGDTQLPPVIVHLARDPKTKRARIVGLERR